MTPFSLFLYCFAAVSGAGLGLLILFFLAALLTGWARNNDTPKPPQNPS